MKILFICRSNAGRSAFAEALFNNLSKTDRAISAGTTVKEEGREGLPSGDITIRAMAECGIDISKHKRRQVTEQMAKEADKVIVILTKPERESVPEYIKNSGKVAYWDIKDMRGTDLAFHIRGRGKILARVKKLVKE